MVQTESQAAPQSAKAFWVNPRTLSSPARRASQDSSTPAASAILPRSRSLKSDYSTEETGIPSSAAPPATGTLSVQLHLQHSDAVDPPGLIRDATSSTLNKSSLAVNPRTLSSPARRASQDSSTPAIQLGLPPLLRPAIVSPRRTREDATRRQTERAREQKQKQKQKQTEF